MTFPGRKKYVNGGHVLESVVLATKSDVTCSGRARKMRIKTI